MSKTIEERLATLERQVNTLREWHLDHESNKHLGAMAQRIANRLFELGPEKVDLRLIAKLSAALGHDVMPIVGEEAPKKARKYATKPSSK
jgi:hypothetical protein